MNKWPIGYKEGLHRVPLFVRPSAPVLLEPYLDCAVEGPGAPLVLLSARLNTGVYETPGLRQDPCLTVAFPPRWNGNFPPELGKHAVYPVQGICRPNGEACALPEVARVRGRRSSTDATHNQVVVCVMSCVPYHQVMEQATIYAHDLVGPGAHLPTALVHGPCPAVLQPRLLPWEEVSAHVLQTQFCHRLRHLFVRRPALRRG